jgi:hypothetical protein
MKPLLPSLLLLQAAFLASAQTPVTPVPPQPAPSAPAKPASEYLRFMEVPRKGVPRTDVPDTPGAGAASSSTAEPDRLQTAVTRFEKDGTTVDLVGVVHLADAAYFKTLNERFKAYDAVLYEMVGGPHRPDKTTPDGDAAPAAGAVAEEVGSVRQLQQLAKAFFGLEYQLDGIDYAAPNFVHADVGWLEMETLMKARNETLMTLFTRAMSLPEDSALPGIPADDAAAEAMMRRLFSAVVTGDSAGLKRTLAPFLSEAEHLIAQLEGEDGTVLVRERNRVVLEKFAELRRERGPGTYAIFYGAGHMPDFEQRFLDEGFTKGETTWLDAWTIPAPGSPGAAPAGSPVESILRVLSSDPEVMKGLQDLGTTLEGLGGALKSLTPPPAPE